VIKHVILLSLGLLVVTLVSCVGVKHIAKIHADPDSPAEEVAESISERLIEEMLDLEKGALKDKLDFSLGSPEKDC